MCLGKVCVCGEANMWRKMSMREGMCGDLSGRACKSMCVCVRERRLDV